MIIRWSGWKHSLENDYLVGQFTAVSEVPPVRRAWYASYPGGSGSYQPGADFDCFARSHQCTITKETSLLVKQAAQRECFKALLAALLEADPVDGMYDV